MKFKKTPPKQDVYISINIVTLYFKMHSVNTIQTGATIKTAHLGDMLERLEPGVDDPNLLTVHKSLAIDARDFHDRVIITARNPIEKRMNGEPKAAAPLSTIDFSDLVRNDVSRAVHIVLAVGAQVINLEDVYEANSSAAIWRPLDTNRSELFNIDKAIRRKRNWQERMLELIKKMNFMHYVNIGGVLRIRPGSEVEDQKISGQFPWIYAGIKIKRH